MLEGFNILVAEDNIVNQKIANYILQKQGAVVKIASSGREAIDQLSSAAHFDIVLMDLQMPGMDGFTTAKYIRNEMKNNVPIIGFSASIFADEMNECIDAGMNTCILKPFDPNGLCELILSVVKNCKN
jgi:CheY-like chemotaxis protein